MKRRRNSATTDRLWRDFRDCRRKAYWAHIEGLQPINEAWSLRLGRLIHRSLELWHRRRDLSAVLLLIDGMCGARAGADKRVWHDARAMMTGYAARYAEETLEIVALGAPFGGTILNPKTRKPSRSFSLSGRVDGVVKLGNRHYLLEHRTASEIDKDYIDALWADFQVTLRANYIERQLGLPITGCVYDILLKARLRQRRGESAIEFTRRRDADDRVKPKRRMPESDESFAARLAAKYSTPRMFHREIVEFDPGRRAEISHELWALTQSLLHARRRGVWYQNTSFCFHYRRPCEYLPLCQSGGAHQVKQQRYKTSRAKAANGEVAA